LILTVMPALLSVEVLFLSVSHAKTTHYPFIQIGENKIPCQDEIRRILFSEQPFSAKNNYLTFLTYVQLTKKIAIIFLYNFRKLIHLWMFYVK
jgi:hypothetical protein